MMRKITMCFVGAMMVISLAACTPTDQKQQSGDGTNMLTPPVQETEKEIVEKVGDPNAPVFDMAFVYYGNPDATGLERVSEDVETLDAQVLVDLLIQHGMLEEGTTAISFEMEGAEKAGPGVDASAAGSNERIGTLDLSTVASTGTSEELVILTSIGNTFIENFELDKLKLLVNGENYSSDYLVYDDNYKHIKK